MKAELNTLGNLLHDLKSYLPDEIDSFTMSLTFTIGPVNEITKTITDYIDQCEGKHWMDIAQKLSRVFAWEYEDYQP